MPPQLALLLCSGFVLVALFVDFRRSRDISATLWVPFAWVLILASRQVPYWFSPAMTVSADVESGSAIDRAILVTLMVAAAIILAKRRIRWELWFRQNAWLVIFFLYCGVSVIWSDFPELSLKRWFRAIGAVMMILVILTEDDPVAAVTTVIRRCGYILIPFSVLFIKYYRELGVGYNMWTGEAVNFGVTTDKNALGRLCMVWGVFIVWEFLTTQLAWRPRLASLDKLVRASVFIMAMWLLRISHSATALVCFILGSLIVFLLGWRVLRRNSRHLGLIMVGTTIVGVILNVSLDLSDSFLAMLGKNPTLTNRTFIWEDLLERVGNPIIGVGYDSFWVGERLEYFVRIHKVTSAHNGYLDVYLELGMVGLFLFGGLLYSVFRNAKRALLEGADFGRLRMAILLVFIAYNVTEAGWRATHFSFFVLVLVGIQAPLTRRTRDPAHGTPGVRSTPSVGHMGASGSGAFEGPVGTRSWRPALTNVAGEMVDPSRTRAD